MNALKIFGLVLVILVVFLNGCAAPATPPQNVSQVAATNAPVPTLVSPTDAPTATNPPPTATKIPPTNTATKIPPTNTPTHTPTHTATATATQIPTDTPTSPPTATIVPTQKPATKAPTKPPAPAKAFSVAWKTNVGYEGRDATTFWCKFHNQYDNLSAKEFPFQGFGADIQDTRVRLLTFDPKLAQGGYQPVIGIANADGSINRWRLAGWYAKALGWSNGIEPFPPNPLAANSPSDDWTWYSISRQGEYCKYAYVKWQGQTSAVEFAPDGTIVNTNATLPPDAP